MLKYFPNRCNGTFLELGALDGKMVSNSFAFESIGWKGMCIEANPRLFKSLLNNRPACVNVNALISTSNSKVEDYLMNSNPGYNGLSRLRNAKKLANEKISTVDSVKMKTSRLDFVFAKHGITHVDFFSLDVEGAEMEVLQSINFDKVTFGVFLIEGGNTTLIRGLMERNGYVNRGFVPTVPWDFVWVHRCMDN